MKGKIKVGGLIGKRKQVLHGKRKGEGRIHSEREGRGRVTHRERERA